MAAPPGFAARRALPRRGRSVGCESPARADEGARMNDLDRLSALCETFPTLVGRPGVRPFDNELLEAQLHEGWVTTGSRFAIQFILSVYHCQRFRVDVD